MEFEWDEEKSKLNLSKRGFDFVKASLVFKASPIIEEDERQDYKETRYRATAKVEDRLITVAYTMRGEVCRIISAFPVNLKGRKQWQ